MSRQLLADKMVDAWSELRRSGTAGGEILFSLMAVCAGAWSWFYPYVSRWFECPQWICTLVFVLVGVNQAVAFVSRSMSKRTTAAALAAAVWAACAVILLRDRVPGFMTPVAPLLALSEMLIHSKLVKKGGLSFLRRRATDRPLPWLNFKV